jgi:hypothetical protein
MSWFVKPEETRIDLSGGQWLQVRKYLTAGETRRQFRRMARIGANGREEIDPLRVELSRAVAYLLEWSLTDDNGKHLSLRGLADDQIESYLEQLFPEKLGEILAAIERHEDAGDAEKKILNGVPTSSPTLQSPDISVGGTNGSVN